MLFRRSRKAERAILIVDVVESTALYERLGDQRARALVGERLEGVADDVASNGGKVVKSMGDGLLCAYPSADDAFRTVVHLEPKPSGTGASSLGLRIVVHRGPVVEERKDLYGDAVNTAARMAEVARPGEVLVSAALVEALATRVPGMLQAVPPIAVKGKAEPLELFVLRSDPFEGAAMQTLAGDHSVNARPAQAVRLSGEPGSGLLDTDATKLVIGREASCDLRIENALVSRRHVSIERRGDRVLLIDSSMNGTWLAPEGQPAVRLWRAEAPLHGKGTLTLGASPKSGSAPTLCYEVEDA